MTLPKGLAFDPSRYVVVYEGTNSIALTFLAWIADKPIIFFVEEV